VRDRGRSREGLQPVARALPANAFHFRLVRETLSQMSNKRLKYWKSHGENRSADTIMNQEDVASTPRKWLFI
jgi:hypothetical protein